MTSLDPLMQADRLVAPVLTWGSSLGRREPHSGTFHFYADDYRFQMLLRKPLMLPGTGCAVAVEPNFTLLPGMSESEALYWTSCKRALGRLWQSRGVRLVVDLNVEREFAELNLGGVPAGWKSYAVRSQRGYAVADIAADFARAVGRAGTPDVLFCVFGGGKSMALECGRRGWVHVPEHLHVATGRVKAHG